MSRPGGKIGRADFFKSYLFELLDGVSSAFPDELSEFANKFPELIRPPGAGKEREFLELCRRCGACVKACPFYALRPVSQSNSFDLGTPALRAGEAYCRFCKDFPCVKVCPSGALSLAHPERLKKIATASVIATNCLRSNGEQCETCREKCDTTAAAITCPTPGKPPLIDAVKCSGCGACSAFCPAYPENAIKLLSI